MPAPTGWRIHSECDTGHRDRTLRGEAPLTRQEVLHISDTANVPVPPTTQDSAREWATTRLRAIEEIVDADGLTIISPMQVGVEHRAKIAIEARENRRNNLFVILDTPGGVVEVVERIVRVLRQHYTEVKFIIPDRAMSAGTVLAMSGDDILMDYHSCLGPIDPQLVRDDRLVPALSYLTQYENLIIESRIISRQSKQREDCFQKAVTKRGLRCMRRSARRARWLSCP